MSHHRDITRSVQPGAVPPVIRWLGAYGPISPDSMNWECSADRPLSAEVLWDGASRLTHAPIGLLVDTDRTTLLRCYEGDAHTPREWKDKGGEWVPAHDGHAVSRRQNVLRYVTAWDRVCGIKPRNFKWYCEAVMVGALYHAVVLRDEEYRELAEQLAARLGVPVLRAEDVVKPLAAQQYRRYKPECCGQRSGHRPWCPIYGGHRQ